MQVGWFAPCQCGLPDDECAIEAAGAIFKFHAARSPSCFLPRKLSRRGIVLKAEEEELVDRGPDPFPGSLDEAQAEIARQKWEEDREYLDMLDREDREEREDEEWEVYETKAEEAGY